MKALELYGTDWDKVVPYVGTRTKASLESYYRKYYANMKSDPDPVLEVADIRPVAP